MPVQTEVDSRIPCNCPQRCQLHIHSKIIIASIIWKGGAVRPCSPACVMVFRRMPMPLCLFCQQFHPVFSVRLSNKSIRFPVCIPGPEASCSLCIGFPGDRQCRQLRTSQKHAAADHEDSSLSDPPPCLSYSHMPQNALPSAILSLIFPHIQTSRTVPDCIRILSKCTKTFGRVYCGYFLSPHPAQLLNNLPDFLVLRKQCLQPPEPPDPVRHPKGSGA